jgi:uncharacterized protein YijF (DUF1287 family)
MIFGSPLRLLLIFLLGLATTGWKHWFFPSMIFAQLSQSGQRELAAGARFRIEDNHSFASALAQAALDRAGLVMRFDSSYHKIGFPHGDVPASTGCAADEIVRAYRQVGYDLQELVYLDMTASFGAYPKKKDKYSPDTNIDHRIVENLQVFFKRCGTTVSPSRDASDYAPGDIVVYRLENGQSHIAIVVPNPAGGRPWIVHNVGYGPRIEDRLFEFHVIGHYRYHPRA